MKPERIKRWLRIGDLEKQELALPKDERTIIGIDFEEPVDPEKGFKRLRSTGLIKELKEKGLHVVPLPQKRSSQIALLIGTAALIGSAYLGYRHFKERSKRNRH